MKMKICKFQRRIIKASCNISALNFWGILHKVKFNNLAWFFIQMSKNVQIFIAVFVTIGGGVGNERTARQKWI